MPLKMETKQLSIATGVRNFVWRLKNYFRAVSMSGQALATQKLLHAHTDYCLEMNSTKYTV